MMNLDELAEAFDASEIKITSELLKEAFKPNPKSQQELQLERENLQVDAETLGRVFDLSYRESLKSW